MPRLEVPLLLALLAGACSFDTKPTANQELDVRGGRKPPGGGSGAPDSGASDGGASDAGARDAASGHDAAVLDAALEDGGTNMGGACGSPCPDETPICLSPSGRCVECASDKHCKSDDRPACDEKTRTCVACTADAHCPEQAPRCDGATHTCVQCTSDEHCADADAPVCDPERKACVGCAGDEDCAGDTPHCDPAAQVCVACTAHEQCEDPARPQCEDARCVPCASNDACTERDGTPLCDSAENSPTAGRCVQCTTSDESACGGTVCNPTTGRCTDRPVHSRSTCEPCIADSECALDHRCIAMKFQGNAQGAACLKRFATECQRPFAAAPIRRASLSGAPAEDYCGIDEELTTCAAIADLIADVACTGADEPTCPSEGSVCRTVNGVAHRCTYVCGGSSQCPLGFQCSGGYCGGSAATNAE